MNKLRILIFIFITWVMGGQFSLAQDTNYWTYQYGTKSTLLGGSVIGSVLDLSGTFYNPGGLALMKDPDVLLANMAYQYPTYSMKKLNESDVELSDSIIRPAPSMVAGILNLKTKQKYILAYSYFTRHMVEMDIVGTVVNSFNLFEDLPGNEEVFARVVLNETLSETWAGLTWAYRVAENIGIGITQYLTLRSHEAQFQLVTEILPVHRDLIFNLNSSEYEYLHISTLWKLGLALDFRKWTLGLTLTTPSIKLYGIGAAGFNVTSIGQFPDETDQSESEMSADYQQDVNSHFSTPFSIGFGFTYKLKSTKLYFSAEWYSAIKKFTVLDLEKSYSQTSGEEIDFSITHEVDSVINVAIGIEHVLSKRFAAYASFRTDYSAESLESDANLTITNWDLFHFVVGAIFSINKYNFTFGIGYSYGTNRRELEMDQIREKLDERLLAIIENVQFDYSSIMVVLGFSF
jgi:hypothetical protein